MVKTLVIVESPAKCKKIESFLGPGYQCIASFGHIQQLDGLKCVDIANHFKPSFTPIPTKQQQISKIRKAIKQCDEVLLATDDDREGEAIAWHICEVFKQSSLTTKRIIFHEVTKTALQNAVANPTTLNMDIIYAQQARQILDLIVGYKISPILWNNISRNSKTGLSAGRCQTPALRIVYENQSEIDKSPGTKVYNTTGYFTSKNLPYILDFHHESEKKMEEFLEESVNYDHNYTCGEPRKTTKNPPSPFTTSGLQQMASNELRYSPKDTMKICQTLYEGGYITYMRTDSKTYSKEFLDKASSYIDKKWGKDYIHEHINRLSERKEEKKPAKKPAKKSAKKPAKDDNKAQEAHESIRPTNIETTKVAENLGSREKRMYKLIWRNTMESCMSPALYSSITSKITAPEDHCYKYSTELVVFPGWKIVNGYEKENPIYHYLLSLKQDIILDYKKIVSKVSLKDLKSHYTEAKLVQILEQKGIGRPSTFSSLIDKIQERNYVKKENVQGKKLDCIEFELINEEITEITTSREFGNEKNKLVIQPLGVIVIEFLLKHFDSLFQYDYTKNMEDTLDVIAKGESIWHELCKKCLDEIDSLSIHLKPKNREQYKIDENHIYMIGKYGPVIKCTLDGKTSFKRAIKDIDIQFLKEGKYQLADIVAENINNNRILGTYKQEELVLKKGKYGLYVVWGKNNKSLSGLNKSEDEITLEDVIEYIENTPNQNILREIDAETSIRRGKNGGNNYVFYKTKKMKRPKFISLKSFKEDYLACDLEIVKEWITEKL